MTTKMQTGHGHGTREMSRSALRALSGHADPGRFGRMFPGLDPLEASDDALSELAGAMRDASPDDPAGDNPGVPAGITYLGQFIDHDITLDLTPLREQEVDPLATQNFRTPALDLDSLYGPGAALTPYFFERDSRGRITAKLLLGTAAASGDGAGTPIAALPGHDLPRNHVGRAIIGDERNDENLLVAQTHVALLRFHNAVVDWVKARRPALSTPEVFDEARRLVTWHYQWIVLHEFADALCGKGLVDRIRHEGRRFYRFRTRPYMPVEFAAAAYRLGHSMVRETYSHNRVFRPGTGPGVIAPGTLGLLFFFTGKSGAIVGDLAATADPADFPGGPGPQEALPSNWVIDWRRFFDFGTPPAPGFALNASRRIDPFVVPALHRLPGEGGREAVLPFRNLRRGVILELPSGQDVARAMGIERLSASEITSGTDGAALKEAKLHKATPLWYYILKEAEQRAGGRHLGPAGATIVAETLLGLVHGDQQSYLYRRTDWKPELPSAEPGDFRMTDLIAFAGGINPVG